MHFCFVFRSLEMGGIQTLMARMARWLVAMDHSVTIFAAEGGSICGELPSAAQVVVNRAFYESLRVGGKNAAGDFLRRFVGRVVDVFYCFSAEAIWVAAGLLNAQGRPARCLGGVYGPSDYGIGPAVSAYPRVAALCYPESHLFFYKLPESCRIYMNAAIRDQVHPKAGVPVRGKIWPLPVDGRRFSELPRRPEQGLVVSVGRLAPMKEYNLWMIDVVGGLRKTGLNVRWDVYGDGPYRSEMEARIRVAGLQEQIQLKGEIRYENLGEAFSHAQVFVGMGTALIEAGFAGLPSIAATVYEHRGMSYGFLHELPDYACGEKIAKPVKPVADLIRLVCGLSSGDYERLATSQRNHAARFDMSQLMEKFLGIVSEAPQFQNIPRNAWRLPVARVYRKFKKLWHGAKA